MAAFRPSAALAICGSALAAFALSACSAERHPPQADLAQAELSVQRAMESDAPQQSPLELNRAHEKLRDARDALRDGDNRRARFLADEAEVDARLAEVRAEAADARRTADETQQNIETLRNEAERAVTPRAPLP